MRNLFISTSALAFAAATEGATVADLAISKPAWWQEDKTEKAWDDFTRDEQAQMIAYPAEAAEALGMEYVEGNADDDETAPLIEDSDRKDADPVNVSASKNKSSYMARAIIAADKAKNSPKFHEALTRIIDATETSKNAPLYMLQTLQSIYSKDDLNGWPMPDSTEEQTKGTNRVPDRYSVPKKGNQPAIRSSFYADWFACQPEYGDWFFHVENCRLAEKKPTEAKKEYLPPAMSPTYRDSLRQKMEARITAGRGVVKKAAKVHFIWQAIEQSSRLEVSLVKERKGKGEDEIAATTYPILVKDKVDVEAFGTFALSQFLLLKPWDLTKEQLDSKDAFSLLMDTAKAGTSDDENETAEDSNKIADVQGAVTAAANLTAFLSSTKGWGNFLTNVRAGAEGDETFLTVGALAHILSDYFDQPENEKRYQQLSVAAHKASGSKEKKAAA